MTDEEFWALIALADMDLVNQEDCLSGVEPIVAALSKKSPDDICAFEEMMSQKLYVLDNGDLLEELEASSDSFLYQRCYALVSGPRFYVDMFSDKTRNIGDFDWCESLIYVAQTAWENSQDSEWDFTASVSYETGSNEDGYKPGAKLKYQGDDLRWASNSEEQRTCDTIGQAIGNKDFDLALKFIEDGADPNLDNPLYSAVDAKNKELVARLIEKGADVNQPIVEGGGCFVTPLERAVSGNMIGIAKLLLAAGASPTATRKDEFCPLQTACVRGNIKMTKLLLDAGADPDTQMPGGRSNLKQGSPLFAAVESEKPEMVELVLSYGANPDIVNENGNYSALDGVYTFRDHIESSFEIMKVLVKFGANVNRRTGINQHTILQSATEIIASDISEKKIEKLKPIIAFLIENGGKLDDGSVPDLNFE